MQQSRFQQILQIQMVCVGSLQSSVASSAILAVLSLQRSGVRDNSTLSSDYSSCALNLQCPFHHQPPNIVLFLEEPVGNVSIDKMDAEKAALLFPHGYQTTEDLEDDLSLIRCKLDNVRNAEHSRLIPQLLKLLEKREKLLQQIQCEICDHLLVLTLIHHHTLYFSHPNLNSINAFIESTSNRSDDRGIQILGI